MYIKRILSREIRDSTKANRIKSILKVLFFYAPLFYEISIFRKDLLRLEKKEKLQDINIKDKKS